MDELYRGHRIAIRLIDGHHVARVTAATGKVIPISARVSEAEGAEACMLMARSMLGRYLGYVSGGGTPPVQ